MTPQHSGPLARGSRCALVAFLLLAAARLAAQVYEHPLTEQDLQRLMPVLKAERAGAARLAEQAREREALQDARNKARQQAVIALAGGGDPLEWLTKLSPNAAAPSTARYEPDCSRALTQADADPSAVFSFGIAAPPAWLAVWRARDQSIPIADRGEATSRPGTQRPGATRPETVTQQSRSFYAGRGFDYAGEPAPFEWQFTAPDKLTSATVMGVNVLGRVAPCGRLSSGPLIVLKAEGEAFAKAPKQPGRTTNIELAGALEKAGLREGEYLNLRWQLLTAQADARDPSRLNAPPSTSEEQRKTLAIRRENAEFYRQHESVLAPLLAGLTL